MALIPDPFRYRLHLAQVGLGENVSAIATQLDGAGRGSVWTIRSDAPVDEFLARPNLDIPPRTPLIRLDLTGEEIFFDRVLRGPTLEHTLPAGHIAPMLGTPRRHAGEGWAALTGHFAAPDVFLALAPSAGVVIDYLAGNTAP